MKAIPNLSSIRIYSWYDFPIYSEFHNSGITVKHSTTCEFMNRALEEQGYTDILKPYDKNKTYTETDAEDNWIHAIRT